MKIYIGIILVFLIACKSSEKVEGMPEASSDWSQSMKNLQKTFTEVEEYLFDTKKFNDPKNQEFLKAKISQLNRESKNVNHNPTLKHRDPTIRYVSSQFSNDLHRADQAFQEGKTDFARYQLIKVTSNCVQCHTRKEHGIEMNFSKIEPFVKKLPTMEQAEFLIASRKFDNAFNLLLKALVNAKPNNPPSFQLERIAGLALQIAVQSEQSPGRALLVVEKIQNNKSIPYHLKTKAQAWKESIASWKSEKPGSDDLNAIRKLVKYRSSEVDAMRAIPKALKILENDNAKADVPEALLLAGESYEVLNEITPLDIHHNYFEACIRSAPATEIAKRCYKELEDSVYLGYTGTSGVHMPADVQSWLSGLKKLSR